MADTSLNENRLALLIWQTSNLWQSKVRLKFLGASCILDRLDCDYDTEGSIEWSQKFFEII